jgi:hypothetical protein
MNIKWFDRITNEDLWSITQQETTENQIKRRKWYWIGHILRTETVAIQKTALDWNPQGYRRKGRPKRTWRRIIKDEIRGTRRSRNEVKGIAGDRITWKPYAPQGVQGSNYDDDDGLQTKLLHADTDSDKRQNKQGTVSQSHVLRH